MSERLFALGHCSLLEPTGEALESTGEPTFEDNETGKQEKAEIEENAPQKKGNSSVIPIKSDIDRRCCSCYSN